MRELKDKATGLTWYIPEIASSLTQDYTYIPEDKISIAEFTKELNQYTSEDIHQFVTGNCAELGSFIQWVLMNNKKSCYCFDNGKLVAASVITPSTNIDRLYELKTYVNYCESNLTSFKEGISGFISYKKAKAIIENASKSNNTSIDYLVVVPPAQNNGVGSRAVRSIKNNQEFFAPYQNIKTISTQIHDDNAKSLKIFKKNLFDKYSFSQEDFYTYNPLQSYITTL